MTVDWITGIPAGTWMIFGVVFVPVYGVLLAWYLGSPREAKKATMGIAYLTVLTVGLWAGLFVTTLLIDLVFF